MLRRKRKHRRKRNKLPTVVLGILSALFVLTGAFLYLFQIRKVIVVGQIHEPASEITNLMLERPTLQNSVLAMLMNTNRKITSPGFVESINVTMEDRNTVRVSVREKRFVGRIRCDGMWWYFDREGSVSALSDSPLKGDGIPEVTGLELTEVMELNARLPLIDASLLERLEMILTRAEGNPVMAPDRVEIKNMSAMVLVYGNVRVEMGNGEKFELRLKELAGILAEMDLQTAGTLHMETYDGSDRGIVFEK